MRSLLEYLRPHWRVLLLGLVLGLAANAANLAAPLVTKRIIDTLGAGGALVGPITLLVVLVLLGAGIGLIQWTLLGTLAERVVLEARTSIVRRYFAARLAELTRRPTGELVTRVTSDTGLLHEASSSIVGLINASVAFVATLVLMGVLDLVLLACTLGAVVLVGAVMAALLPTIGRAQRASQESVGQLGGDLEGALRAIRTVKASRAETRQSARIEAGARQAAAHNVRAARRAAWVWTVAWTGIQLAVIMVLGIGAWRAELGLLSISTLIAFLLYAFQLMGPISELTGNVTALQSGIAAAARIREVTTMALEPRSPASPAPPADLTGPVIELRDVTLTYTLPGRPTGAHPDHPVPSILADPLPPAHAGPSSARDGAPAVRGIDLAIPRRGHTAIVGPSGAGKTTLFSLILRFLEPQEGELRLDGRPYGSLTHGEIRARLAYVEQETPVVPGTVRDNLLFTHPDASDDEVRAALAAVHLDNLDLDASLLGSEVSGGERQRIALARAILRTPDVLLLDEATAQVDGLTEAALQDCVRSRAAAGAVVTIAHRLSTVLDADRIIVMENGRIRAEGTHDDLLASDSLYRQLVEALRIATSPVPAA